MRKKTVPDSKFRKAIDSMFGEKPKKPDIWRGERCARLNLSGIRQSLKIHPCRFTTKLTQPVGARVHQCHETLPQLTSSDTLRVARREGFLPYSEFIDLSITSPTLSVHWRLKPRRCCPEITPAGRSSGARVRYWLPMMRFLD